MNKLQYKLAKARDCLFSVFPELLKFDEIKKRNDWTDKASISNMTCLKLIELWQLLLERKPSVILELGPGWTTFVFNRYLETYGGTLFCVEESKEWTETLISNLSREGIYDINPIMSETIVFDESICYKALYNEEILIEPDFVYVDGPANTINGKHYWCSDAVNMMLQGCRPDTICFDIRNSSFQKTDIFPSDYKSTPNWLICSDSDTYHNVMRKI